MTSLLKEIVCEIFLLNCFLNKKIITFTFYLKCFLCFYARQAVNGIKTVALICWLTQILKVSREKKLFSKRNSFYRTLSLSWSTKIVFVITGKCQCSAECFWRKNCEPKVSTNLCQRSLQKWRAEVPCVSSFCRLRSPFKRGNEIRSSFFNFAEWAEAIKLSQKLNRRTFLGK